MFVLDIELLRGRYPAAAWNNTQRPEWPPHPARAFCGLVASAKTDDEWHALRWLESQDAPDVWVSRTSYASRRSGYVVTNTRSNNGGSQFHPARSNAAKDRVATQPASARINIVWREADCGVHFDVLKSLARRVPYLGRSDGAILADARQDFEPSEDQTGYGPGPITSPISLRVPYQGYVAELERQYLAGRPAWEVGYERGYVSFEALESLDRVVVPSPFVELFVLRFVSAKPLGGLTVAMTSALRRSVMSVTRDPLPPALHGHDDSIPHVAFLALPNVGNANANGDLLALGLALPKLSPDERRRIVHGVLSRVAEDNFTVRITNFGEISLTYAPERSTPLGANAERWTHASREWASATPLVLDRHPKRNHDAAQ